MNIRIPNRRRSPAGFTMIELLVAVTVSVMLLSILAFVFSFATKATQAANTHIAMTERIRSVQIRLRNELGNMLVQERLNLKNDSKKAGQTWEIDPNGQWVIFSTKTDEDGREVQVDVKYEFKTGTLPTDGALIRRRDSTGPYVLDSNGEVMNDPKSTDKNNPLPLDNTPDPSKKVDGYILGDNKFFQDGMAADKSKPSTIMLSNVRKVLFKFIDPPNIQATTQYLNPRLLPSGLEMDIQYGAEKGFGETENLETMKMFFPIYRGL